MSTTFLAGRSGLAGSGTRGGSRTARRPWWRSGRHAGSHRPERRGRDGADRTDRYLDRAGVEVPLSVVTFMWQR